MKRRIRTIAICATAAVLGTAITFLACMGSALAAPSDARINGVQSRKIAIPAGKSLVIEMPASMKRVSVAAPNIADALILTPRQIYVTGRMPGVTNLTVWDSRDEVSTVFDIDVSPDVGRLKAKLHEMFPDEASIGVTSTNDGISLTGSVSGTAKLTQVAAVAATYAPLDKDGRAKVINLLEVGGVQQVMLEVRVSEMSKTLARNLGINFAGVARTGNQFGVSLLNALTSLNGGGVSGQGTATGIPGTMPFNSGFPGAGIGVSTNVTAAVRFMANGQAWTTFIDALEQNNLLRVLAEPTLITLSGKSANFLAGGEFPIPVPQAGASVPVITIQYKPFGVALSFTPTVLGKDRINMVVAPEVSELDFSQAVSLQGYIVPSITTRRLSTTVELADGQSFAIAGLLKDEVKHNIAKYPFLGDIPIIGALFRSSSFQRDETELVVIVTPHLVKPLDMSKQTLPTDGYVMPDDYEFYLEGRLESRSAPGGPLPRTPGKGGLEGSFGYIVPDAEKEEEKK